jgi:signal transduction histidine kinase/integral membrane sensor domain MASE1/CheY-like chemotaxis protein
MSVVGGNSVHGNISQLVRQIAAFAAAFAVFFILAWLAIATFRLYHQVALLWPANAAVVCMAISVRQKYWPALFAGAIVANVLVQLMFGDPIEVSVGLPLANLIAIAIMVLSFDVLGIHSGQLTSANKGLAAVVVVTAANVPAAIIGALVLNFAYNAPFHSSVLSWWASDSTSALIVLLPFLTFDRTKALYNREWFNSSRLRELMWIAVLMAAEWALMEELSLPRYLVIIVPLIWVALRFGAFVTAAFGSMFAIVTTFMMLQGWIMPVTPRASMAESVFTWHVTLILVGLPFLFVALSESARDTAEGSLKCSRALAEKKADELHKVLSLMSQGLSAFDGEGRLTMWNRRYAELYQFDPEILKAGVSFLDIARARQTSNPVEGGAEEFLRQFILRNKRGEAARFTTTTLDGRTIVSNISPLSDGGWIATHDDISEELATERKAQQAEKMDALGQLTGGMAHDFNNILAVIIGNLQVHMRNLASGNADDEQVKTALHTARRGSNLTSKLLTFARSEKVALQSVDLACLIADIQPLLTEACGPGISFKIDIADGTWPAICDAAQLEMALLNLAINSRDACDGQGTVTLRISNVLGARVDGAESADQVMISVMDTGRGIARDIITRVTEPFFTTKESGRGTGLGLSMVHGLVERCGGTMSIESEVGSGTTVNLMLRRAEDKEFNSTSALSPRSASILVVDDDFDVQFMTMAMLKQLGLRGRATGSAQEALEMLRAGEKPTILLTDVRMPGSMNGVDLAERAVELRPGLKVIITSGYVGGEDIQSRIAEGGFLFMGKPFDLETLDSKIKSLLGDDQAAA